MKKKCVILSFIILASGIIASGIGSSLGWFTGNNRIETDPNLGGSVLEGYFHDGKGTSSEPFTITTPRHYENLIKLHYSTADFAKAGYFFEFGKKGLDPEKPNEAVFYSTNDNGKVDFNSFSKNLNLGGSELPPLGTEETPFVGHINGNDLTVSNFVITGKECNDVGIFGFVDTDAEEGEPVSISNCYWNNFKIDTTKADLKYHVHSLYPHEEKAVVGYLAGHVVDSSCFTNCYINDCEINGTPSSNLVNTYSYYGLAEYDSVGGEIGKGGNYNFTLDSNAVYNYFDQNYTSIANSPFRSRNTEYAGENYNNGSEITSGEFIDGGKSTKVPFSNAVNKNNNYTYSLNGTAPGETATRNYSLSTMGYRPLDPNAKDIRYELSYKDNNQYVVFDDEVYSEQNPTGLQIISNPNDEAHSFEVLTSTKGAKGTYLRIQDDKWKYFKVNEQDSDYIPVTFTFTIPAALKLTFSSGFATNKPIVGTSFIKMYIDGREPVYNENVVNQHAPVAPTINNGSWSVIDRRFYNFTINGTNGYSYTYKTYMKKGTHYYSFMLGFNTGDNNRINEVLLYSGTNPSYSTSTHLYGCKQNEFTISDSDITTGSKTISQSITNNNYTNDYTGSGNNRRGTMTGLTNLDTNHAKYTSYPTGTVEPKQVYGDDLVNNTVSWVEMDNNGEPVFSREAYQSGSIRQQMIDQEGNVVWETNEDGSYLFDEDGNKIPVYETIPTYTYRWLATVKPLKEYKYVDEQRTQLADIEYVAKDEDPTNPLTASGYNSENIDVVGGGISFFHANIGDTALNVINIESEYNGVWSIGRRVAVHDATQYIGEKFYATKYCPNSIVLYLKNYANPLDNRDSKLGSISFSYVNITIGGQNNISLTRPVFKKGCEGTNGTVHSLNIEEFGADHPAQGIGVIDTIDCTILESGAQKCSYCALDENGTIICTFDDDGIAEFPASANTQEKREAILKSIDTYVMAIGSEGISGTSYVTKIDFSYKAAHGAGGTFGSVGYRDSNEKIENTIINFYYLLPANESLSIKVKYSNNIYTITTRYSGSTGIDLYVYNYDPDVYSVVVGATTYTDSEFVVHLTS